MTNELTSKASEQINEPLMEPESLVSQIFHANFDETVEASMPIEIPNINNDKRRDRKRTTTTYQPPLA